MATARELRWIARDYRDGDLDGAWYAIACTDDPAVNAAVGRRGAAAPGVLRARRRRPGRQRGHPGGRPARRVDRRGARRPGARGAPPRCAPRWSRRCRPAWWTTPRSRCSPGVALVGGGPGDPELITVRGRRLLARADVVVTDRLGPRDLLDALGPARRGDRRVEDPVRAGDEPGPDQRAAGRRTRGPGKFVVRLKGGDPYVFGRGFEEVLACAEAGVAGHRRTRRDQRVRRAGGGRRAGVAPRGGARDRGRVRARGSRRPAQPGRLGGARAAARHGGAADGRGADRGVRGGADRRRPGRRRRRSRWCRTARCASSARSGPPWPRWPTWCASGRSPRRR